MNLAQGDLLHHNKHRRAATITQGPVCQRDVGAQPAGLLGVAEALRTTNSGSAWVLFGGSWVEISAATSPRIRTTTLVSPRAGGRVQGMCRWSLLCTRLPQETTLSFST